MSTERPNHICRSCWDGDHSNHVAALGGICIGCSCSGGDDHQPEMPCPEPCCTACDGRGAALDGPCSDCLGTGHTHLTDSDGDA